MRLKYQIGKSGIVFALVVGLSFGSMSSLAQDLVPVSSLTGGSSVFVFRNTARAARRTVPAAKPSRTAAQRKATASRIKRQYDTIAQASPKTNRATVVDPNRIPPNASRTLPPGEASVLFSGVGEFYVQKGDFEQSFDFFLDAMKLDSTNEKAKAGYSEAMAMKGNDLLVKDQAGAAKAVFQEALKFDSTNAAAYFGLGEVYSALDQYDEAIANYEKSLQSDKDLTEIYVPLGILYYQTGEIAKADTLLTKALEFSSSSAETQFFLGLVRAAQNRIEPASEAFNQAKTLDPKMAEAFFNSGEMLVKLKKLDDAIADYQKAVDLKPDYFDAWFSLGEAYFDSGNYGEAVKAFKAASRLKNDNWEVFAQLGEANRRNGSFEDAEANFNLASIFLTGNPGFDKDVAADLYSKIGLSVGQQCDINMQRAVPCKWQTAIRALKKAVELTESPIDYVNLGWAYFRLAHPDAEAKNMTVARPNLELAQQALQKAIAGGGPAAEYGMQNLASVQIDLGDLAGAITTLTALIEKRPDLGFSKYQLGVAYNRNNDLPNAEKWLKAALADEPQNVNYMLALGENFIMRRNGKEVKQIIERVKPLSADTATRLEAKMKIARL